MGRVLMVIAVMQQAKADEEQTELPCGSTSCKHVPLLHDNKPLF